MPAHPSTTHARTHHAMRREHRRLVSNQRLLDAIELRFRLLHAGPQPLSLDGRRLRHGLPARRIPLPELSAILMHPSCDFATRDAVWRLLIGNARDGDPAWVVGAVGVALPGLRNAAHRLSRCYVGDVQATLVTEFLAALQTVAVDRPGVISRLLDAASSSARRTLRAAQPVACGEVSAGWGPAAPPAPFGHPDLVLARAVRAGIITAADAELIGITRLERVSLTAYAQRLGVSRWHLYRRRTAAEARLVTAIGSGALRDPYAEVIAEATPVVAPARQRRRP